MSNQTGIEKVQAEFLKEIESGGMEHALRWIGSWYTALAKASLDEDMARLREAYPNDHTALVLWLTDTALDSARRVANYSTSPGENLLNQARAAVQTTELAKLTAGDRSDANDAWREAIKKSTS